MKFPITSNKTRLVVKLVRKHFQAERVLTNIREQNMMNPIHTGVTFALRFSQTNTTSWFTAEFTQKRNRLCVLLVAGDILQKVIQKLIKQPTARKEIINVLSALKEKFSKQNMHWLNT